MSQFLHWVSGLPEWLAIAVLALLPLLEASTFVGVLVPGETALLLAGVLVHEHEIHWLPTLVTCALAAVAGDALGYAIGRRWGERLLHTRLARRISARRWERARRYLHDKGSATVFFGRFAMGVRSLIPMLAGTAHMPLRRFARANIAGGVVWAAASIGAGWVAGAAWERAHWIVIGVALVVAVIVAVISWKRQ